MGILDLLVGNKHTATAPKRGGNNIEYCNEEWWGDVPFGVAWVQTDSDSVLCQYSRSLGGNYIVAWNSGNGVQGDGKLIILRQERIIYVGNIKRPFEAAIANNGMCIFHDCPFTDGVGVAMKSAVYIISPDGDVIFGGEPGSATVGISPDGSYAAYMGDANTLCFVDIQQGRVAWQFRLPYIWPQHIVFDDGLKMITLKYVGKKSMVPRSGDPLPDYKITYSGDSATPDIKNQSSILWEEKVVSPYRSKVLNIIRSSPGILQSEVKKRFTTEFQNAIILTLSLLQKEGKIRREKKGRSFQLWVT